MITAGHVVISSRDAEADRVHEFYLICDDLEATMRDLTQHDVTFGDRIETSWGVRTTFRLPGGGELGLYEPKHPMAVPRP